MIDLWFGLNDWTRLAIIISVIGTILLFIIAMELDKLFPKAKQVQPSQTQETKKEKLVIPKYYIECLYCNGVAVYMIEDMKSMDPLKASNFYYIAGITPKVGEEARCMTCGKPIIFNDRQKRVLKY
jgi:hypothetical protein